MGSASLRRRGLLEREYPPSGPPSVPKEYLVALDRSYFGGKKGEIGWKHSVKAISREAAAQTAWAKYEKTLLKLIKKGIRLVKLYVSDPEMLTKGLMMDLPQVTVYNEDIERGDSLEERKEEATIIDCHFFKIKITKGDFVVTQTDAFGGAFSIHPPSYRKKKSVDKFRDFVEKNRNVIYGFTFKRFIDELEKNSIPFEVGSRVKIPESVGLRRRGYVAG